MEVPTARSIATLEKLVYVSAPWIEESFEDLDEVLEGLVKRPTRLHEELWERAIAPSPKVMETTMNAYREHERIVRDSLDGLLDRDVVLVDPIGSGDRRRGVSPLSPRNDLRERLASIDAGRFLWVGPLLVPFDVSDDGLSLPLANELEPFGFTDSTPWEGYVRFSSGLFDARADPFDREGMREARARAQLARSMLGVRVRAIESRLAHRGPSDERRVYGFSSGPLWKAIKDSPHPLPHYKQIGGRLSSGRREDEQGLPSDAAMGKLAGYLGSAPRSSGSLTNEVAYTSNERYPWLLEPQPHRLDILVERLRGSFGDVIDRFGEYARDRGIGVTNAISRLADLAAVRVSIENASVPLTDLVRDLGPIDVERHESDAPIIRPSDASIAPYACALAHHISHFDRNARRQLLSANLERGTDEETRTALLEHRDPDSLESYLPAFGSLIHAIYRAPWVEFETDYARYGPIEDLVEKHLDALIDTASGPAFIRSRADIALVGASDTGRVPVIIDRKLAPATEHMMHTHRRQLALMLGAYRELAGPIAYGIGVVDASAPFASHPHGYRAQRFVARRFSNEEIDSALETAAGLAYARDSIRSDRDVLAVKDSSASYQLGPKGGRAAPLCASCGVAKRVGDEVRYRGSLAMRMVCDELVETAS